MSAYQERLAAQQQQRMLENQAIEADLAQQGYARTWEAPPSLLKWTAVALVGLCVGVFLGAGALLAALIVATIIWYR